MGVTARLTELRTRGDRAWHAARPLHRRALLATIVLAVLWFARCEADRATEAQTVRQFPDSGLFLQLASQPFAWQQVYGPKPVFPPRVFRALDRDALVIAGFQEGLAVVAWLVLGAALVATVRRRRARIAATAIVLGFVLAPLRLGWADTILSESLNDSLMAIVVALAVGLALVATRVPEGRRRTGGLAVLATVLGIATVAWIATRDTNAITTLVACGAIVLVWRTALARARWLFAPLALAAVTAGFVVYSTGVASDANALVAQNGARWPRELSARGSFPMIDNVLVRILPDPDARELFVDRGMPQVDELMRFAGKTAEHAGPLFLSPRFAEARAWLGEHGAASYLRWLVGHPLARGNELAAHVWEILAPRELVGYMPPGWGDGADPIGGLLGGITTSETLLLGLLLAMPFALRRPRRHPLTGVALVVIASGCVGAAAAYYGDTLEIVRHCYGAGQQIVLGLYLALIAWLDGAPDDEVTDERTRSRPAAR